MSSQKMLVLRPSEAVM